MSKKSLPILYSNLLYKMGNYRLSEVVTCILCSKLLYIKWVTTSWTYSTSKKWTYCTSRTNGYSILLTVMVGNSMQVSRPPMAKTQGPTLCIRSRLARQQLVAGTRGVYRTAAPHRSLNNPVIPMFIVKGIGFFFTRNSLILILDSILGSAKDMCATWQWNADMKDQERGTGGGMRLKPWLALPLFFFKPCFAEDLQCWRKPNRCTFTCFRSKFRELYLLITYKL